MQIWNANASPRAFPGGPRRFSENRVTIWQQWRSDGLENDQLPAHTVATDTGEVREMAPTVIKIAAVVAGLAIFAANLGFGPTKKGWMATLATGIAAAIIITAVRSFAP
jgi:hypothetical protein